MDYFLHIIIEGRTFDSVAGLLLSTSPLARHTGIVRFWTQNAVVRNCTIKWAHSRTRPWGNPVPYQCPRCHCIQAWEQKGQGASSELHGDVTMRCSYKGEGGKCGECLTFRKAPEQFKALKQPEGTWVAFGLGKADFL
jgi:hypothetical protein